MASRHQSAGRLGGLETHRRYGNAMTGKARVAFLRRFETFPDPAAARSEWGRQMAARRWSKG